MSNPLIKVPAGITVTANSIVMEATTSKQDWAELGKKLVHIGNSCQFWIGDWAEFGFERFPESMKEFCQIHGQDYGTIRNRAYVSRAIPPAKRKEKLAWALHAELAQLDLFDRDKMISRIEAEKMSLAELRQAIRREQGSEVSAESDGKAVRFASRNCDALTEWISSLPEDFFQGEEAEARRVIWKQRLKPMAELYAKL